MNFVWLYEGKLTEELELSLALVKHFYPDATSYVISTRVDLSNFDHQLQPLQILQSKHADQLYKLREALPVLPETFYVMNDDFFLTDPIQHDGDVNGYLSDFLKRRKVYDDYRLAIDNTIQMLDALAFPLFNFELHKPLLVDRSEMQKAFALLNEDEPLILWRSLYGNTVALSKPPHITNASDVKNIPFGSSWCLSTDSFGFPRYRYKLKEILNDTTRA